MVNFNEYIYVIDFSEFKKLFLEKERSVNIKKKDSFIPTPIYKVWEYYRADGFSAADEKVAQSRYERRRYYPYNGVYRRYKTF